MSCSPCGELAMEAPFLPPVSAGLFWCLVFDVCPAVPFGQACYPAITGAAMLLSADIVTGTLLASAAHAQHSPSSALCKSVSEARTGFLAFAESLQFELVSGKSDEGDPWCSGVGNVFLCS